MKKGMNMDHGDIIIFALIAVVLLARLWTVFGRRNDEDRQRPNPFATPAPGPREDDNVVRADRDRKDDGTPSGFSPLLLAPNSLAGALEQIKQIDNAFDEKAFLKDARTIFAAVVGAFAKSDLSDVKRRLGPAVLPNFEAVLAARRKAGEKLEIRIARIREAETTAARLEGNRGFITVRFVSEQEIIMRDAVGNAISGAMGRTEEVVDLWVFARDLKSSESDWQIIETKS
jgi:predicted lipid-binding transport protein (Tim44 family)